MSQQQRQQGQMVVRATGCEVQLHQGHQMIGVLRREFDGFYQARARISAPAADSGKGGAKPPQRGRAAIPFISFPADTCVRVGPGHRFHELQPTLEVRTARCVAMDAAQ